MFNSINLWAVLVSAISIFLLGGVWYSPKVFGTIWAREAGVVAQEGKAHHSKAVFAISFILAFISALVFALFLGVNPPFSYAVGSGLIVGVCWVATSFGINYAFAKRGWKMFLIDGGYHVVQFVLYGIILGLWH